MRRNKVGIDRVDMRMPMILCAAIGFFLIALLAALALMSEMGLLPTAHLWYYAVGLLAVYLLSGGGLLMAYLARYRRVSAANAAAELMATEISDMFRYVVDVPYAIVSADGTVKIVNGAMQDILQLRSPLCNVPLSSFCTVSMKDIIGYAQTGAQVKDVIYNEDGAPMDNTRPMITELQGKKYNLQCYTMRVRGKDYYFVVFDDVTDLLQMKKQRYDDEPVVAYVVIDSLQELAQYVRVSYRTAVSEIETILKDWAAGFGGMIREYEREKYLVVFNRTGLDECIGNKLETIRRRCRGGCPPWEGR